MNKPDPSILPPPGPHIRHNYRSGPREQLYQRQPTLPSLPEMDDAAAEDEEGEKEEKRKEDTFSQRQQLTTL